jgi:RimJ/RimL family protein N-acetyltransferase
MAEIRLATTHDVSPYRRHLIRHSAESGKDGDIIFAPFEESWAPPDEGVLLKEKEGRWSKSVTEVGWERCWVLGDGNEIYGDLKLVHQPPIKTSLHRATLMMGIERSHRGQGWGARFIETALSWTRENSSLEWLDLYVFTQNIPAIGLYTRFGFRELGRTPDFFRVNGQQIDDIHMALKL